jgi:hypothetical protein
MNGHDRVLAIVLASEHLLGFTGLDLLIERVEPLFELGVHVLTGLDPLGEHAQILALLAQRKNEVAVLLDASPALQDLLCFGLVSPEIGRGSFGLDSGELVFGLGGLKDSYADPQRVG